MITIPKANENRDNFPCWKELIDENGHQLLPIIYCKCGKPLPIHSDPNHYRIINGVVGPFPVVHYTNFPEFCGFDDYLKLEGFEILDNTNPLISPML